MSTSSYTAPVPGCRGSNLAIVSLSTSCQISINTFPSGKPSSSCASVYLFRPITNTAIYFHSRRRRNCQHSLKTPAKPQQTFFRAIPTPLFPAYTLCGHVLSAPAYKNISTDPPYVRAMSLISYSFLLLHIFSYVLSSISQNRTDSIKFRTIPQKRKDYPNRAIIPTKSI